MVRFERVSVVFANGVVGLSEVTLTIRPGEFVFLTGTTGAGKSTLLKLIYAEVLPAAGRVLVGDRVVNELRERDIPALRRSMGVVPQDFGLLPNKRMWENIAYALRVVGMSKREIRQRVPEILERVGIGHRLDSFPAQLSGGEAQRAAIARALAHDPSLLLADEPTGNLDSETSWGIIQLLDQINARGATVIVASHDEAVIQRLGRRVVRLERGEVVSDSDPCPDRAVVMIEQVKEANAVRST
ncbi:MAG: ATP-binding cassette domain-containing protein [Fimbriimonadia bacterium]|jgi:cell division transport system ATP-binding protein